MSLHEDVNAGLQAISRPGAEQPLTLDAEGWCGIPVPMLPEVIVLAEGQMLVEVRISPTGKYFSLFSALAVLRDTPRAKFLETLLRLQHNADHVSGISFGIAVTGDQDVLTSVYHWPLDSITPEQFRALFKQFVAAVFDHIGEIKSMAPREPRVKPIHPGRP